MSDSPKRDDISKKIIIILIIITSLILIFILLKKKESKTISISNSDIILEVGDKEQIIVNDNIKVNYKSNNENIAIVNDDGIVQAISYGYTTITVSNGKSMANINVTVIDNSELKVKNVNLISSNQLSKDFIKKEDKLIIKVNFNHNINQNVKLLINNEEIMYQLDNNKDNIVIEKIVQGEEQLKLYVYIDNIMSYEYELPIIDNVIPTCTMKYEEETIKIVGEDNNKIEGYSIAKTKNQIYSSNQELKTTDYGTWYGFVRDYAGNIGECSIEVRNPNTIIDPSTITIVGDSRMEDLCRKSWYKEEHGTCIAKTSKGVKWLNSDAIGMVNNLSQDKKKFIVTNLGVNDYARIKDYLTTYERLVLNDWKNSIIILLSVNPSNNNRESLNQYINNFNRELISFAARFDNVSYCDSNTYLRQKGFQTTDGVHYTQETSKDIYFYLKQCVQNFYK